MRFVRSLLLPGILAALIFANTHSISSAEEATSKKSLETKQNLSSPTDSSSHVNPIYLPKPVKRFIGSVARQGELPTAFHGKRYKDSDSMSKDDELEPVKRYLGSILRQGGIRNSRISTLPEAEADQEEESRFSKEDELFAEKRHLASLAGSGDLRPYGSKGRRFSSGQFDKRYLGSLVRAGELGPSSLRLAGKRYLGSLVRGRDLPFRLKRSVADEFLPQEYEEENAEYTDGAPFSSSDYLLLDDTEEDDLMMPMEKKHIASLVRSGWLPYFRTQRKPAYVDTNVYRQNYQRRTYPSTSPRRTLFDWFRQEEERAKDAKLREEQMQKDTTDTMGIEGKRTLASLVRNGMLPSSYRANRSARDTVWGRSPNSRSSAVRYHFSQPRGFIKSPHAFPSLHSNSWSRYKRSISSIARIGMLRDAAGTTNTESPCKSNSGTVDVDCVTDEDEDEDVSKRHLASLARTNQFPMKREFSSEEVDDNFSPSSFDDEEFEDSQLPPVAEIGF